MALKVERVSKRFGSEAEPVEVLKDVSFDIPDGQAAVITGPSGCGKSTLLHIVGTLDTPTDGEVEIDGQDPFTLNEDALARFRNRGIGFVFQEHHLLPQYSVLENVLLPTLAFGDGGGGTPERARHLIDRVGLGKREGHRPAELSGGEKQRAAVARALINSPTLLLCDEPTGSLDGARAEEVADLLFELHEQEGNILICVTHSATLAGRFDRRFGLSEGTCVEA